MIPALRIMSKIKGAALSLHRCWRRLQVFVVRGTPTPRLAQEETVCCHCGHVFTGNYCPRCGQNSNLGKGKPRLLKTFREAYPQLSSNFIRTMIHFALRPGYMLRDYFSGHRVIYQSPVSSFLIAISIVALCTGVGDRVIRQSVQKEESIAQMVSDVYSRVLFDKVKKDKKILEAYTKWKDCRQGLFSGRAAAAVDLALEKLVSDTSLSLFAFFPLFGLTSYCVFYRRRFYGRRLKVIEHYVVMVYLFAFFNFIDQYDALVLYYMVWTYRGLYRLTWWQALWRTALMLAIVLSLVLACVAFVVMLMMVPVLYYYVG